MFHTNCYGLSFPKRRTPNATFSGGKKYPDDFLSYPLEKPRNPGLFDIETREFAPTIEKGDRLAFRLRANATVSTRAANGKRQRHDVVMNAIRLYESGKRAEPRRRELGWLENEDGIVSPPLALKNWIERQGDRSGLYRRERSGGVIRKMPHSKAEEEKGRR